MFSGEKPKPRWCLESTADGGRSLARVPIQKLPFHIGRLDDLELTLPFQSVSKRHAVLHVSEDGLYLRDLSSTNGTFVNRQRVSEAILEEGDILHFAEVEFRVGRHAEGGAQRNSDEGTSPLRRVELSEQFIAGTRELNRLLEREMVTAAFQPIVSLPPRIRREDGRHRREGPPDEPCQRRGHRQHRPTDAPRLRREECRS